MARIDDLKLATTGININNENLAPITKKSTYNENKRNLYKSIERMRITRQSRTYGKICKDIT